MIKGIINISLAFLFLFTSSGVILNRHYCGDKFISSSIFLTPNSCCNGHCNKCHNEATVFKITDNYQDSSNPIDFTQHFKDLIKAPIAIIIISFIEPSINSEYFSDTSPPPGSKIPSLLQVFRL